jgi:hypothetical protein
MSGPERELTPDEQADIAAMSLGRTVTGRDLTPDEAEAMKAVFRAAVQALRHGHGFIRRLADHVVAERTDEAVEEFFEDQIRPE